MNNNGKHNIKDFLTKEATLLYRLVVLFFIAGYTMDIIFHFDTLPSHVLYTDFFALTLTLIVFLIEVNKLISMETAFIIITYTSTIGLLISYYYSLYLGIFNSSAIFQDLITIPPMIFAMGFIVNKRHMVTLGIIFFIFYPLLMFLSKDPLLVNSALFIATMILGATIAMFIFIGFIEKSLITNDEANRKILEQKQELEKLNEEKTKLLALIAHDLRNPVGNAMNVSSFLMEEELTSEEREEVIKTLYSMNKKAYDLLENLLQWARNEEGTLEYKIESLSLRDASKKSEDIFELPLNEKSITVKNKIDKELKVLADKVILGTVFRNLLSNAIKFSKIGGKILLDAYADENTVTAIIKDYGTGMKAETVAKLFDEDSKITPAYGTRNEKGTGIGMKITKSLVEKINGNIRVESKIGEGTTFYVTFPRAK